MLRITEVTFLIIMLTMELTQASTKVSTTNRNVPTDNLEHRHNHHDGFPRSDQNAEKLVLQKVLAVHTDAVRFSRPVLNVTRPVWVSFGLVLSRVIRFDERKELLTVLGWTRMVWHNEYLPWNATTSGVGSVRLPADRVWTPDIHSYNGYEKTLHVPDVILSADGLVLWVTQKEYKFPCSRNLSETEWTCRLRLSSTTYDGSRLQLTSMWHSIDLSAFDSYGHVRITETTADRDDIHWPCCAQPYPSPSVVFTIVMQIQ